MADIDEILADAIRTTWLQMNGPELGVPNHIEMAIARRIRAALEREGVIIAPSHRLPGTGTSKETHGNQHARIA